MISIRTQRSSSAMFHCVWLVLVLLGLIVDMSVAEESDSIRIQVLDDSGQFIVSGEVEFEEESSSPVSARIDEGGFIELNVNELEDGIGYEVYIYDPNLEVLYKSRLKWTYKPSEHDCEFDLDFEMDKYVIAPIIQGFPNGDLEFAWNKRENPLHTKAVEEKKEADLIEELWDEFQGLPRIIVSIGYPLLLGKGFVDNEEFGVQVSGLGFSVGGSYRMGYPEKPDSVSWISFRELSLSYTMNRYVTDQKLDLGEESDVSFHRITAGYGLGWLRGNSHVGASAVLAFGGIYDGTELLEYLDRSYNLFGIGVQGYYLHTIRSVNRFDVGITTRLALIYYPVENLDEDHWYGLEPSLMLGVAIY